MLLATKDFEDGLGPGFGGWPRNPLEDVTFYHHDALGSVVMLTDDKGHAVESYQYDVYGKAYNGQFSALGQKSGQGSIFGNGFGYGNGKSGNVYGFTGRRYEPEAGLYAFTYRHYNPQTMRWQTLDPIKDGLNWYEYCGGDPVNWVDPMGLKADYWGVENPPGAYIKVTSVITSNFEGNYGTTNPKYIYGMKGYEEIEYISHEMSEKVKVDVWWGEDNPEKEEPGYEYPAEPGTFPVTWEDTEKMGTTYPIKIEHPEPGNKIHLGNWSEGCVPLGDNVDIYYDLSDIVKAGGGVIIELNVVDLRTDAEKEKYPLPYEAQTGDETRKTKHKETK